MPPVFGPDHQHVAAIALGDDLFLEILRRVAAAQVGLERPPQPLSLPSKLVPDARQRRTGIVLDVAVLADGLADPGVLDLEPRGPARDGREGRQSGGGAFHQRRGAIDRVEEVGQSEQPQRLQRKALVRESLERGTDGFAGAQGEGLMILQQQDRLTGKVQRLGDPDRLGRRNEPV